MMNLVDVGGCEYQANSFIQPLCKTKIGMFKEKNGVATKKNKPKDTRSSPKTAAATILDVPNQKMDSTG